MDSFGFSWCCRLQRALAQHCLSRSCVVLSHHCTTRLSELAAPRTVGQPMRHQHGLMSISMASDHKVACVVSVEADTTQACSVSSCCTGVIDLVSTGCPRNAQGQPVTQVYFFRGSSSSSGELEFTEVAALDGPFAGVSFRSCASTPSWTDLTDDGWLVVFALPHLCASN